MGFIFIFFRHVYFGTLFVFISCKWSFSGSCRVMHKAIWCVRFITLRGREVSRAADRLHKPPPPHKRKHVLSNCQNLYFKDCDRSSMWCSRLLLCLWCLCASASVWATAGSSICVAPRHMFLHLCVLWVHPPLSVCTRVPDYFVWLLSDKPHTQIYLPEVCNSYTACQYPW